MFVLSADMCILAHTLNPNLEQRKASMNNPGSSTSHSQRRCHTDVGCVGIMNSAGKRGQAFELPGIIWNVDMEM